MDDCLLSQSNLSIAFYQISRPIKVMGVGTLIPDSVSSSNKCREIQGDVIK
jgi:hypothetical protein